MKTWKKVLFNVLGCGLFLFVGGVILGVIIEDNELAYSICLKIVLGYVFILSFISFIQKVKETMQNISNIKTYNLDYYYFTIYYFMGYFSSACIYKILKYCINCCFCCSSNLYTSITNHWFKNATRRI